MCITKEDVLKVALSMYPKSIYYVWITKKKALKLRSLCILCGAPKKKF